jgi:hypothetical protein
MQIMPFVVRGTMSAIITVVGLLATAQTVSAAPLIDFSQNLIIVVEVNPGEFEFTQDGYAEGAVVTGTFVGTDLDADGQLSSFDGELNGFAMNFSGNSLVPAFSMGIPALVFALVYDLDGGPLGDGLDLDIEGILALDQAFFGPLLAYVAGPGPLFECGVGVDCAAVSVPEPGLALLCLAGLASAARYRARRRLVR